MVHAREKGVIKQYNTCVLSAAYYKCQFMVVVGGTTQGKRFTMFYKTKLGHPYLLAMLKPFLCVAVMGQLI